LIFATMLQAPIPAQQSSPGVVPRLDLRGYDPPSQATRVKAPMLILHGERDYQVTTDEPRSQRFVSSTLRPRKHQG
jgi:hypothetical protein